MIDFYIAKTSRDSNNELLLYVWVAAHGDVNYNYNQKNISCQTLDEVQRRTENQEATYYLLNVNDISGRATYPKTPTLFSLGAKLTGSKHDMEIQLENYPDLIN